MKTEIICVICSTKHEYNGIVKEGYPHTCSIKCRKTDLYKQLMIEYRGYPPGSRSKQEYESNLQKKISTYKKCIICEEAFFGTVLDTCCSTKCIEKNRIQQILETKRKKGYTETVALRRKTNLERYGNINHLNSALYKEKRERICLDKYGVDNFFKRRDLVEQSWENKFGEGITNPLKYKPICDKSFNTRKSKYDLSGAIPKEASRKTCMQRYGKPTFFGSEEGKMSFSNLRERYNWSEDKIEILRKQRCSSTPFFSASKESLKVFIPLYKFLRKRSYIREDIKLGCSGSKEFKIVHNSILYSYDFTIESLKLIIEYNGVVFHARRNGDVLVRGNAKDIIEKDLRKRTAAELNGYSVLTIWSDEEKKMDKCKEIIIAKEKNANSI